MSSLRVLAFSLLVACAALLASARGGRAQEDGSLDEPRAVQLAAQHNPGLHTSLLQLQAAQRAVQSEQARYDFVFTADTGVTHTESPFLVRSGTLTQRSSNAQAGVGAKKHLAWGTDLTLRLGAAWQESRNSPFAAGFSGVPTVLGPGYGFNARLTLAQPLLRGFGQDVNLAELNAARARRSNAERTRDRVASELLRDLLSAYWELWMARQSLAIQEQSRAVAEQQRDEAQARVRTGSLAPTAALTFETRVATRAEDVLAARSLLEQRRTELRQRMGIAASTQAALDPREAEPPVPAAPPEGAVELALAESTTVLERQSAVELAETQARTAADPLRSRLDVEAYVQADGLGNDDVGAAAETLGTLQAVSAHVGVTYEAPFSSTRQRSEAARARLSVDVARSQLEEAKLAVRSQVEVALTQHSAARERLTLAERTADIAGQQLAAEQARLAVGASTPLAVVQAEDELRAAKLRVARARTDLRLSAITIEHWTGSLLARHAASLAMGNGAGTP